MSEKRSGKNKIKRIAGVVIPFSRIGASVDRQRESVGGLLSAVNRTQQNRVTRPELVDEMQRDRSIFLAVWGIHEHQIPRVVRGLRIEAIIYALLALVPVAGLVNFPDSLMHWTGVIFCTTYCLTAATIRCWRLECVESGKLIKFGAWVRQW